MKEIGSEFWLESPQIKISNHVLPSWLEIGHDNKLLLSGRTAIHYILKDIQKHKNISKVYFPSYSCQSMLQPFLDLNIDIVFYEVYFNNGLNFNIDLNQDCDIFFGMNYFGFNQGRVDKYIEEFSNRGVTVIEDATHSLLSKHSFNPKSDYIVVSLRKWFPIISGGLATKNTGRFILNDVIKTNRKVIDAKKSAMIEKMKYINGDPEINKSSFMEQYRISNQELKSDYKSYSIDEESFQILYETDINQLKQKRRRNVEFLYNNLNESNLYNFMFSTVQEGDLPIFVPLIFNNKLERDSLRKYLIDNSIYFPVHWPIPDSLSLNNGYNITDHELSVVIDQRYDVTDMEYVIRRINEFYE